MLDKASCFSA